MFVVYWVRTLPVEKELEFKNQLTVPSTVIFYV